MTLEQASGTSRDRSAGLGRARFREPNSKLQNAFADGRVSSTG